MSNYIIIKSFSLILALFLATAVQIAGAAAQAAVARHSNGSSTSSSSATGRFEKVRGADLIPRPASRPVVAKTGSASLKDKLAAIKLDPKFKATLEPIPEDSIPQNLAITQALEDHLAEQKSLVAMPDKRIKKAQLKQELMRKQKELEELQKQNKQFKAAYAAASAASASSSSSAQGRLPTHIERRLCEYELAELRPFASESKELAAEIKQKEDFLARVGYAAATTSVQSASLAATPAVPAVLSASSSSSSSSSSPSSLTCASVSTAGLAPANSPAPAVAAAPLVPIATGPIVHTNHLVQANSPAAAPVPAAISNNNGSWITHAIMTLRSPKIVVAATAAAGFAWYMLRRIRRK